MGEFKSDTKATHLGEDGRPAMVDVGAKPVQSRTAVAQGSIRLNPAALEVVRSAGGRKGSVVAVATVAAISAAKRTSELVPLCHNIPLSEVAVDFDIDAQAGTLACRASASATARTGVEMEALAAVHVGLLTVYDMCKAVDREMEITSIRLVSKTKSDV